MKKWIVFVLCLGVLTGNVSAVYAQEESSSSSAVVDEASSSIQDEADVEETEDTTEAVEDTTEAVSEDTGLSGNWIQKDAESADNYQIGYIRDGVIELYWMQEDGTPGNLYWSGSFEEPEEETDSFTWESVNDKRKTGYALMASQEETKTFAYENEEISYEVSILGQDVTINLVKTDTDYNTTSESASESTLTMPEGLPVEFVSGNYSWYKNEGAPLTTLYYSVQIHNPNDDYAVNYPNVQVTARAADRSILTTYEQMLPPIAAGDTVTFGTSLTYEGNAPDKVEMIVGNSNNGYVLQNTSGVIRQDMLAISNVSEIKNEQNTRFTGEVTNNSTISQNSVCVVIVFKKNGDSIGGINTIIDSIASGASRPFEISVYKDIMDYDSYEVYALPWG